jgi:hypothetical protein
MTTTAKAPCARRPDQAGPWPPSPWDAPPFTAEEHLKRIEALGERIAGHFRFMCQVGSLSGTSAEMKTQAIAAFYERAILMETQLGQIQEELRHG